MNKTKVIIFDFDGTLVKSNDIKNNAYYQLFPDIEKSIISDITSNGNALSRYEIIQKILTDSENVVVSQAQVDSLSIQYGEIVTSAVKGCSETEGATSVLNVLSASYPLFLSSLTPAISLLEIIRYRDWQGYFKSMYGYPAVKSTTLYEIMKTEGCQANSILVIGDGDSDEDSASEVGCQFFKVSQDTGVYPCLAHLGV